LVICHLLLIADCWLLTAILRLLPADRCLLTADRCLLPARLDRPTFMAADWA
jgi:hypothetical protein